MRLPNSERAVVDIAKLRDYCLDATHPRGRRKARAFAGALNLTAADAGDLRDAILASVQLADAVEAGADEYGRRFTADITVSRRGRSAGVRTAWIIRRGEDFPRLTSCYVV